MPRIIVFAPNCYPPQDPEAFVNANLIMAMRQAGWDVIVYTQKNANNRYPADLTFWKSLQECTRVVEEPPRTFFKRSLQTLFCVRLSGHLVPGGRWAVAAANAALKYIRQHEVDVIISRALPHVSHLAALIVKRKTGKPWIANWNDPVPKRKFPCQFEFGNGPEARLSFFEKRYYRAIFNFADWHTFPSWRLRRYIDSYFPWGVMGKSSIVPHLLNTNFVIPEKIKTDCFVLLYAGSFVQPRSPANFFEAVRRFRNQMKGDCKMQIRLVLDNPRDVVSLSMRYAINDIVKVEQGQPYTQMPTVFKDADVLLIIEGELTEGIFLPSKFVDYVATGRPILALSPKNGTLAEYIEEFGGGLVANAGSVEEIVSTLNVLYSAWASGELNSKYGSSIMQKEFSADVLIDKLRNILSIIR